MYKLVVDKNVICKYGPAPAVILSLLQEREYQVFKKFNTKEKFTYTKKDLEKDAGLTRERLDTILKKLESLSIIKLDCDVLKGMNFIVDHDKIELPYEF